MSNLRKQWRAWSPAAYLKQYYSTAEIPSDEKAIYDFINSRLGKVDKPFPIALEFGSGPTLHHAVFLLPYVLELHLADYVLQNLEESKKWLTGHLQAHNWDVYFEGILNFKGKKRNINDLKQELKNKVKSLKRGDLEKNDPLTEPAKYPLVASFYCADSATKDKDKWGKYMNNLFNLVAPGGYVIFAALRNSSGYKVGDTIFPSANVDENDVRKVLVGGGFDLESIDIQVAKVEEWKDEGFDSVVLAFAQKNA